MEIAEFLVAFLNQDSDTARTSGLAECAKARQAEETTAHQACGRTDKKCDMGNIGLTQREAVHDEHHPQQGDLLKVMFSLSISLTLGLPLTWLTWLLPTLL
ncbi:uncharacterized protein ACWYII_004948 isoform 2-T2 [Salvelinus alpinus]